MNLKALITSLVLGSSSLLGSSAAMADSIKLSGSVHVSLGSVARPARHPAPRPAPRPTVAVGLESDCGHPVAPAPVYHPPVRPVVHATPAPVYRGPFYNPTNTIVGRTASQYTGWIATSSTRLRRATYRNAWVPVRASYNTGWFDLTEATRIDGGREFFKLGADKGVFKMLKLQALGTGRSNIKQVGIEYVDGLGRKKTQVVKLNTWISAANNPTITIDLDGGYRKIGRIIVYGSTDRGSAYKLLAM